MKINEVNEFKRIFEEMWGKPDTYYSHYQDMICGNDYNIPLEIAYNEAILETISISQTIEYCLDRIQKKHFIHLLMDKVNEQIKKYLENTAWCDLDKKTRELFVKKSTATLPTELLLGNRVNETNVKLEIKYDLGKGKYQSYKIVLPFVNGKINHASGKRMVAV